jgi:hypothetical protein
MCLDRQVLPDLVKLCISDPKSRATIAHPSMTSRLHNGRDLRSTGIVPIRKIIPAAMQSRPTVAGSDGESTDAAP